MSVVARLGQRLDEAGLRKLVALGASVSYGLASGGRQRFEVDPAGRWVNRQPEATIVSPDIHTSRFEAVRDTVLENWAWQYRPKPGDTVVDVGAGVGEEAVVFSKMVGPRGRVVSIEAHPQTFACLEETVRRSGLPAVTPLWCAVSDRDGAATICESGSHLANSIVPAGQGSHVPARSLDSLADELGLDEIALLKMNIEGAERLAVQGMERIAERIRHIVISCHDFISDGGQSDEFRTFEEVRAFLEGAGFEVRTRPDHPSPWVRYYLYGFNKALRDPTESPGRSRGVSL
jgi:FkbM family methyltransferase